jgi:hypothetical protein
MKFTVVGFYSDNMQPFVGWVEAKTPQLATDATVKQLGGSRGDNYDNFVFVEVFRGHRKGQLRNTEAATIDKLEYET